MSSTRKLILIADDYDSAAELLACLIEFATRYDTMAAKDGVEALELAAQRRPDAAVLDIDMPRIDGITAARMLGERFPDDPPIRIAVTGGTRIDEARASGHFDHVLRKPVPAERMIDLLNSAFDDAPGTRAA